jgi:hypothetical protein
MTLDNTATQASVNLNSGECWANVEYERVGATFNPFLGFATLTDIQGPVLSAGWNRRQTRWFDRVSVGGSLQDFTLASGPGPRLARFDRNVYANGKLHNPIDFGASVEYLAFLGFNDRHYSANLGYNSDFPNHFGISWSGGTFHGQPFDSVTVSANASPNPHLQMSISYLTDDYLPQTTPTHNRVWHGGVTWLWTGTRSLTVALREESGGFVNVYTVYRNEFSWGKQLIIVLGDPNTLTNSSRILIKLVNRL